MDQQGQVRLVVVLLVWLLLGFALGALWHYRRTSQHAVIAASSTNAGLSDGTKAVLQRLVSPVEIRFYSVLDPETTAEALQDFARRVDRLLSEFEKEGGGKVRVIRHNSPSDSATAAASADGIRPFNLDKGEASYLGLVVAQKERKEVLAESSPDWEPALEADLSRAIARVTGVQGAVVQVVSPAVSAAVMGEVRRLIPNVESVSIEDGTRILREKAMVAFEAATQDMDAQLKAAEEGFLKAEADKSEPAQQEAREQLQRIRSEQAEKLKQIAARLHEQIAALEQIKRP